MRVQAVDKKEIEKRKKQHHGDYLKQSDMSVKGTWL
jgi:hypothetical protein